jgi:hypothetical protein
MLQHFDDLIRLEMITEVTQKIHLWRTVVVYKSNSGLKSAA